MSNFCRVLCCRFWINFCAFLMIIISCHAANAEVPRNQYGFQCDGAEGWYQIIINYNKGEPFAVATGGERALDKLRMKVSEDNGVIAFEGGRDGGPLVAGSIGSEKCGSLRGMDAQNKLTCYDKLVASTNGRIAYFVKGTVVRLDTCKVY